MGICERKVNERERAESTRNSVGERDCPRSCRWRRNSAISTETNGLRLMQAVNIAELEIDTNIEGMQKSVQNR